MKILILSYWTRGDRVDGGVRRSHQIVDLIRSLDEECDLKEVCLDLAVRTRIKWPSGFIDLWLMIKELRYGLRNALRVISDMSILRDIRREWGIPDVVIWEAIASRAPLYFYNKKSIIAFPHNLESLTIQRGTILGSSDVFRAFRTELIHFLGLKHVVTISREESFVLANLGIDNTYLPYYPVEKILTNLKSIRHDRSNRKRSGKILILGSVINKATEIATRKLISLLRAADHRFRSGIEFIICGNGTEMFGGEALPKCVRLLGRVSDARLRELMCEADAALVYQDEGAGALTRIVELLIAGVPVMSTFHAARSAAPVVGLYVFNDLKELVDMVNTVDSSFFHGLDESEVYNYTSARRKVIEVLKSL